MMMMMIKSHLLTRHTSKMGEKKKQSKVRQLVMKMEIVASILSQSEIQQRCHVHNFRYNK
jgi:hypothetical protein